MKRTRVYDSTALCTRVEQKLNVHVV